MLKKKDIENFLLEIPPQHGMDALKVANLFELLRTQPRTVGELSEKLDWDWSNLKRFLTETKRYKDFFIYDEDTREYSLDEDKIRHVLINYDRESNVSHLHLIRDENSEGYEYDPVNPKWFTRDSIFYPCPPRNFSGTETYRYLQNGLYYDPFFTMCYIFSTGRKFRDRVVKRLGNDPFEFDISVAASNVQYFDIITWSWAWTNLRRKNLTFFERSFSYLSDDERWTRNANEDYGLEYSVDFIRNWMHEGPQVYRKVES